MRSSWSLGSTTNWTTFVPSIIAAFAFLVEIVSSPSLILADCTCVNLGRKFDNDGDDEDDLDTDVADNDNVDNEAEDEEADDEADDEAEDEAEDEEDVDLPCMSKSEPG